MSDGSSSGTSKLPGSGGHWSAGGAGGSCSEAEGRQDRSAKRNQATVVRRIESEVICEANWWRWRESNSIIAFLMFSQLSVSFLNKNDLRNIYTVGKCVEMQAFETKLANNWQIIT